MWQSLKQIFLNIKHLYCTKQKKQQSFPLSSSTSSSSSLTFVFHVGTSWTVWQVSTSQKAVSGPNVSFQMVSTTRCIFWHWPFYNMYRSSLLFMILAMVRLLSNLHDKVKEKALFSEVGHVFEGWGNCFVLGWRLNYDRGTEQACPYRGERSILQPAYMKVGKSSWEEDAVYENRTISISQSRQWFQKFWTGNYSPEDLNKNVRQI